MQLIKLETLYKRLEHAAAMQNHTIYEILFRNAGIAIRYYIEGRYTVYAYYNTLRECFSKEIDRMRKLKNETAKESASLPKAT